MSHCYIGFVQVKVIIEKKNYPIILSSCGYETGLRRFE